MREHFSHAITEEQRQAVQHWWAAFEKNQSKILAYIGEAGETRPKDRVFDLPQWVQENLQAIDANLMWEFAPGISKAHRLVITPEGHRALRPLVRYTLEKAPEFEKFEFYEYRLPEKLESATQMMTHRASWRDLSGIRFRAEAGEGNRVDIVFHTPFKESQNNQLEKLWLLTEQLLGEEVAEKWVGYIDRQPLAKGGFLGLLKKPDDQLLPLEKLKSDFGKRIAEIKASLPDRPYFEIAEEHDWVMLELTPEEQENYDFKDDLFVAPFLSAPMFKAMHGGRKSFSPERFSNHGESFLFLKMDGAAEDLDQEIFEDRADIEDALNNALKGLGGMIGGGTGLRYSYIDLAVTDLKAAVPVIQKTLQDGKLTHCSWLFRHDPDYQAEWIGIWPDSPEPFMETGG